MSLKYPDWFNPQDREIYKELWKQGSETWTDQEKEFMSDMYHLEEYNAGML